MINKTKVETERAAIYNFKKTINIALVVYKKKENVQIISLNSVYKDEIINNILLKKGNI